VADPLQITETTGFGLVAVMASKGIGATAIGQCLGLAAPATPHWAGDATLALIGTGPGTWLARCEAPGPDWPDALATRLAGLASATDVSSSYRVFRIAGSDATRLLQRGAFLDFALPAFGPGSVAVTVIAHIGVIIRQIDASPTYELAVFRSLGESFQHWLTTTAAAL
jgi:sarcosine oxidase subunit gamma